MFQCYSLKSSHSHLFPQSPKAWLLKELTDAGMGRRIDRMLSPEATKHQDRGGLNKCICRGKKKQKRAKKERSAVSE